MEIEITRETKNIIEAMLDSQLKIEKEVLETLSPLYRAEALWIITAKARIKEIERQIEHWKSFEF